MTSGIDPDTDEAAEAAGTAEPGGPGATDAPRPVLKWESQPARQAREVREARAAQAGKSPENADEAPGRARDVWARAEATLHDQILISPGGHEIEEESHLDPRDTRGAWPNWSKKGSSTDPRV